MIFSKHNMMMAAGLLSSCTAFATNNKEAHKEQRPNIVLIMADDLGYGDLNFYNSEHINTPNIDYLKNQGVLFTDYHSNGAVCSPTRAALMSGKYQQRVGVDGVITAKHHRHHGMAENVITLAEELKNNDYKTGIFGKWHLGYDTIFNPVKQGFDEFSGFVSGNVDYHSHVDQEGYADWYKQTALKKEKGYTTDLITTDGIAFINRHKENPFFLYLPYETPHYPYQVRDSKADRWAGAKPHVDFKVKGSCENIGQTYREMIEILDENIGRLISSLKEQDLLDNTLILFCSDNGASKNGNNGPLRGNKGIVLEGGHRVPAFAYWQGKIKPGSVCDETIVSFDIYPTLLDVIGAKSVQAEDLDGISFRKAMESNKKLKRDYLVWKHGRSYAVRKGDFKLVYEQRNKQTTLYNLREDIGEKNDLSKSNVKKVEELKMIYQNWSNSILK